MLSLLLYKSAKSYLFGFIFHIFHPLNKQSAVGIWTKWKILLYLTLHMKVSVVNKIIDTHKHPISLKSGATISEHPCNEANEQL